MKTQNNFLKPSFLILIVILFSIGEKSHADMMNPSRVYLAIDTIPKGPSTTLTIQCTIYVPFKAGSLTYRLMNEKDSIIEKTTLWKGNSDTSFYGKFTKTFPISEGSKARVWIDLRYSTLDGSVLADGANLYLHRTPEEIYYNVSCFYELQTTELLKEALKKGYNGLTDERIKLLDPELGKKIRRTAEKWPSESEQLSVLRDEDPINNSLEFGEINKNRKKQQDGMIFTPSGLGFNPDSTLCLTVDTIPKGSVILTIKVDARVGFKEGLLTYQLSDENRAILEKTTLWEGKSDTNFSKQFIRSINLPVESKLKVSIQLKYTTSLDGMNHQNKINLFIHRTARWTTYDVRGFNNLLKLTEVVRDAKERGIDVPNLSIEQIRALDPELANKLEGRPTVKDSVELSKEKK